MLKSLLSHSACMQGTVSGAGGYYPYEAYEKTEAQRHQLAQSQIS